MAKKLISTTALSKVHGLSSKELFEIFVNLGWLERGKDGWILTVDGISQGSSYRESKQYGKYIVWPEDIQFNIPTSEKLITATLLGKHFDITAQKINLLLSEIGWAQKGEFNKGWIATEQGLKMGAIQAEDEKTGIPYIRWPASLTTNKSLISSIDEIKGNTENNQALDGHQTHSKAEAIIDNWLYLFEIVHAYERILPIEENFETDLKETIVSGFYIPTGKVYIEYWSENQDSVYLHRKRIKQGIYKKYGFNLIELEDKDVQNLDDILPKMLLKFGVQTY